MGTRGRAIVKVNVDELLELLNRAFADEWLAYYQYWIGAKIARGPMRDAVAGELMEHANEELKHAEMLAARIIELGGVPVTTPQAVLKMANCGYAAPEDPYVVVLLEQNIKGEQCAINVYQKLADLTNGKDPVTYNMMVEILDDEVEHEEDLQALQQDIELMKKRG